MTKKKTLQSIEINGTQVPKLIPHKIMEDKIITIAITISE